MSSPVPGQYGQYYPAPPSVASQVVSEDAEEYDGTQATASPPRATNRLSSRPSSPPQFPRLNSPPSRRGGNFPGLSLSGSSRPQSATSRKSTTHAPSISSRAFFRPMSSQRLQQQRGTRPVTAATTTTTEERPRSSTSSAGERASVSMNMNSAVANQYLDLGRPESRATDVTERDPRDLANYATSPNGANNSIRSEAESTRPLQAGATPFQRNRDLQREELVTPKTPVSFASNIIEAPTSKPAPLPPMPSRNGRISRDKISPFLHEKPPQEPVPLNAKNYQYFTGNVTFCFGGRLQNTRHRPINIITGFLIIVPAVLFFIFPASYLWHQVSPAIPILFAYLLYICLSSFIHASVSDPGILPRNIHPLPDMPTDDPLAIQSTTEWTMVKSFKSDASAMDYPTKYCKTCNIWRPPRTHHCRICDNCTETQDHHCVWLNNCVGRRNYRYFFTFVSSAILLGLFLALASIGDCIHYATANSVSFADAIDNSRVSFALFLYGILVIPYPVSLTGYHLFLMARGETTREYLNSHKFLPKDRHRPFDHNSIFKNWLVVLLRQRTPTYLRFKDAYVEGDPRFGPRRGKRQPPLSGEQQGGGMEMQSVNGFRAGPPGPVNLDLARQ